jgi:hypothetical protein
MSQITSLGSSGVFPPGSVVQQIQGNSGGPVSPNGSNIINVVGDGVTATVVGNPSDNTLTVSVIGTTQEFLPDVGPPVSPLGGMVDISGVNNITTSFIGTNVLGISVSGTTAHDVQIGNASGSLTSVANGTTGQVLTANSSADPSWQSLPSSTVTLHGDTGTTSASNSFTFNANSQAGSSVTFSASGTTVSLNVTDSLSNTIIGKTAGDGIISGSDNTGLGNNALKHLTSGIGNVAIGYDAGSFIATGELNVLIGDQAGSSYTNSESNNIIFNTVGTVGESNTLRIGSGTGAGNGQLTTAYICGIDGVNVGSTANIVTEVGNQLGTAVLTAGKGIVITPTANVITVASSGIFFTYIDVTTSPYVVLTDDVYLSVDTSGGPITIQFPNSALSGEPYIVKDRTGNAATNNITVTTVGGSVTIDGVTSFVMDSAYQSISIVGNGSTYEIY